MILHVRYWHLADIPEPKAYGSSDRSCSAVAHRPPMSMRLIRQRRFARSFDLTTNLAGDFALQDAIGGTLMMMPPVSSLLT